MSKAVIFRPDSCSLIIADLLQFLSLHTGEEIDSVLKLDWLYDTLLVERLYNKVTTRQKSQLMFCRAD